MEGQSMASDAIELSDQGIYLIPTLTKFSDIYGSVEMNSISTDDALSFLNSISQQ